MRSCDPPATGFRAPPPGRADLCPQRSTEPLGPHACQGRRLVLSWRRSVLASLAPPAARSPSRHSCLVSAFGIGLVPRLVTWREVMLSSDQIKRGKYVDLDAIKRNVDDGPYDAVLVMSPENLPYY